MPTLIDSAPARRGSQTSSEKLGRCARPAAGAVVPSLGRHSQRRALRELADDPHLLADIGLTREQALRRSRQALLAMTTLTPPFERKRTTMSDPIVYGFPRSTYVNIVSLVLTHKDVPYTFHDLETVMGKPEHLALHPFDRVPILRHDDFTVYETSAIVSYVDEAFAGRG